jgi:hypothetical protein
MATAKKTTPRSTTAAKKTATKRTTTRPAAAKKATPKAAPTATPGESSFVATAAAKAEEAMKAFPTPDLTKLDLDALKQLDPRNIDFSKLDPRNAELPDVDLHKLVEAARDAAYTLIGFGVLAVQRAQVQRRELAETISSRFGANRKQVEDLIAAFESRLGKLDEAFEARLDEAVKAIGPRLPEQAETVLNQVHSVARSARQQVRGLLSSAA